MTTAASRNYINNLTNQHPNEQIRQQLAEIRDLYEKKLWHQLTLKLEPFVQLEYFNQTGNTELVQLYDNFIKDFESKMAQLRFVKIVLSILRQIPDLTEAFNFLNRISEKINSAEKEAYSLTLSELALIRLKQNNQDEAKALAEKADAILETITGADPSVYSSYYRVLCIYYKVKVIPTDFYRNSLMYLVYTPIENIPASEQQMLAFDMGIAALVSPDIHNFGELLAHPVLKSLENTSHQWLYSLLFAFNSGDLDKFEKVVSTHKGDIDKQPALASNMPLLRQKICILALMELMFNRTSEERTVPFKVIADATRIKLEEVELLVMKALSLKLIKGVIDELDQTVTINWVQPRVLGLGQINKMKEKMSKWIDSVHQVLNFVQNETAPELLA